MSEPEQIGEAFRKSCFKMPSVVCYAAPDIRSEYRCIFRQRYSYSVLYSVFFSHSIPLFLAW